jgi:hypothetical protein
MDTSPEPSTDQWTIDDFIQSDAYRPLKENIKVKTFVERMRKRHELQVAENKKRIESGEQPEEYIYEPPSPGERFKYVIVKQTQFYDIRGKKINLGKGDLMEFVHVVKKLGLEIDIGQYLKSKVAGICARFINYHPKFQPTDGQRTMKEIDEYCQKMAKKFLEAIVDQYMLPKIDHNKCKSRHIGVGCRFIPKNYNHKILKSEKNTISILFAGPWSKYWTEENDNFVRTLTWGRKEVHRFTKS